MFVLVAAPLIVLAALLFAYGGSSVQRSQWGAFVSWLVSNIASVISELGPIGEAAVKITRYMTHELGAYFTQVLHAGVKFFTGLMQVSLYMTELPFIAAKELFRLGNWIIYTGIPDAIRAASHAAKVVVNNVVKIVHVHTREIVHVYKYVAAKAKAVAVTTVPHVAIPHIAEWNWIHRHWKALVAVVAGAGSIALPLPGLLHYPRDISGIRKRLKRLEKAVGASAVVAVVAGALGVTSRCLRDGNIGKAARRWCGLDNLIADALLADLAFMAGTVSIVEFAKALQKAAPIAAGSMVLLVDEIGLAESYLEDYAKRTLGVLDSLA